MLELRTDERFQLGKVGGTLICALRWSDGSMVRSGTTRKKRLLHARCFAYDHGSAGSWARTAQQKHASSVCATRVSIKEMGHVVGDHFRWRSGAGGLQKR